MFAELLQSCVERYGSSDTTIGLAQWITENTTLNRKPFSYERYPFQEAIAGDEHPKLSCEKCSQIGLALALDTPVPTAMGWTTMGEVRVGDRLFDEQGQLCTVTYISPIYTDHVCYRITLDDGESFVADAGHRWYVESDRSFDLSGNYTGRGRPTGLVEMFKSGVLTTEQLARFHKKGNRNRFAIPNTLPIQTAPTELPVDPYLLGLFLGDGNSHACVLTSHREDVAFYEGELAARGFVCLPSSEKGDTIQFRVHLPGQARPGRGTPDSTSSRLSCLGLLRGEKFVPAPYLRASRAQRLDLLRGLLDTDGSIRKDGRVSFYNNNPNLVAGAEELARSLGFKTRTRWRMNAPSLMKNGHVITPRRPLAEVSFVAYAEDEVFLLPRKRERLRPRAEGRTTESLRRRIVAVEPVPTVPVRCLTVDSPNHLFLAGRAMVPTHNTEIQIRKFFALLRRTSGIAGIFTLPNEKMFKRVYNGRMKPILDADAIFNPPMAIKPIRNMDMTQIFDSFGYQTGCTEGDATSISADILFHDELDLSPMDMIGLFQSRLQNSDIKMTQAFSTPTFLDYGINRQYQTTDQREYLIKCACCNEWQIPVFDQRFIHIPNFHLDVEKLTDLTTEQIADLPVDDVYVMCCKCQKALDLNDRDRREWVATYPNRTAGRGYKVRPFSTARITPGYMFQQLSEYLQKDFLRGFYNTVQGEPFTESSAQLQKHEIEACMPGSGSIPDVGKDVPVFLGLDMGQVCHLTLHTLNEEGKEHWVLFEQIPIFQLTERLATIRRTYSIVQGCADRYPYTPTVDGIRDETAGTIMPVAYGGKSVLQPHRDELGSIDYYTANRTSALDGVRTSIINRQAVLAGYGPYRETIITHLRDMVRDEKPEAEPEWKKLNNNDHFFHSMALSRLARRVCEHVYTHNSPSLMSTVSLGGLILPGSANSLTGNSVGKFSLLGRGR